MPSTAVIGFTEPFVTTHRFYVGTPVGRTATGSGTGTETAVGRIALLRRTATGSGSSGFDAFFLISRVRQATGSGTGTQSASGNAVLQRYGVASAGTGSSTISQILSNRRTATGSGFGSESSTEFHINIRTGTGDGTSGGSANGARTVFAVLTGSGTGTSSAVWVKSRIFRVPQTTTYAFATLFGDERADKLFARIPPGIRGENLYRLSDGTYTINDPRDGSATREYLGGHNIFLTDEEVAELTAAGYGAYIT